MWWGRKHKIGRLHALGLKAPGGRPPRIPYWLRCAVIEEAEIRHERVERGEKQRNTLDELIEAVAMC